MTTYVPAKKNTQLIFYMGLVSQSTGQFQANPTLSAGDVKVATDDGAPANIGTVPVVDADFTKRIKVILSASEMNGDNVTVIFSDAVGAEWDDVIVNIQTAAQQIDDLATSSALATVQADTDNIQTRLPAALSGDGFMKADLKSIEDELTSGNNATLNLKRINIWNVDGNGIQIVADTTAIEIYSGVDADGILIQPGGGNAQGITIEGAGTGKSINAPHDIALPSGDLDDQLQAIDNFIDTEVSAIKAKTDNLPADPADASDIAASFTSLNTKVDTIDDFLDTEVAAIKAKTDQMTFTLAGNIDANLQSIDEQVTTGNNATLRLKQLNVNNSSGEAVSLTSNGAGNHAFKALAGAGSAVALENSGGYPAVQIIGTENDGIYIEADAGHAINLFATDKAINAPQNIAASDGDLTLTNIAKKVLTLDWTTVTGEATRSVLNALRKLRNKVSFNGTTTLTVYKEDGSTSAYTQAVTMDDTQEPFKELGN